MNLQKFNEKRGITLIALVVTIIVLLILAGVSISMLTGQNGILKRAEKSKEITNEAQEKEYIQLAYSALLTDVETPITADKLQAELENNIGYDSEGKAKTITTTDDAGKMNVYFTETEHNYTINNGNIKKIIYFSFYDQGGKFRETLYAYENQTWAEWIDTLMQEQHVYAWVENGIVMGLHDNNWTPDIGFYADQECQKNIEANRIIKDGDIYYAGYGV